MPTVFSISIIFIPCLVFSGANNLTRTKPSLDNLLSLIPIFSRRICYQNSAIEQVESELQWPLFIYPQYGPQKYLLRKFALLMNKSCHLYSHTSAAETLRQIEKADLTQISSLKVLKIEEAARPFSSPVKMSFGGDLDLRNRKRVFKIDSDGMELLCGFTNYKSPGFIVSDGDREAMGTCRGLVVISAIFGGYDRLRQPKHVKNITAENVFFFMFVDIVTLEKLAGHGIEPDKFHTLFSSFRKKKKKKKKTGMHFSLLLV